jgi:methylenetetrahydrofolate dehydrogenase (NADP+)/methenyltetrahydrofolate cyclohydrolase
LAEIIDGKAIAAEVRLEVASRVSDLEHRGVSVRLDVILVGENPASVTYVRNKENDCAEVGIDSRVHRFPEDVTQDELARLVRELNDNDEVSGFFIQLPLPDHIDGSGLLSEISPHKDVDGLGPLSAGRLALGLPALLPCTPHGVLQLLGRSGVEVAGKEAVVLGRSNLVGKSAAQLLLGENATVTVCHSSSPREGAAWSARITSSRARWSWTSASTAPRRVL